MKILLMYPAPQDSPAKYTHELVEVEKVKRARRAIKPIPIEQLFSLRLFTNNVQVQTTYEKFIGRKIKLA